MLSLADIAFPFWDSYYPDWYYSRSLNRRQSSRGCCGHLITARRARRNRNIRLIYLKHSFAAGFAAKHVLHNSGE
jgi:hypothetical protein